MSNPVPFLYRNPPDDVYAFNVDTSSYNPTSNFALQFPVQEEPLVFAADRTTTTYPSPDFAALVTASQSDWHKPVSAMSHSAFAPDELSLDPGTAASLNQRWDSQPFSTGYITEHVEQGGSIPQSINQSHCFQSANMDEVCQTTDKVLPAENAHLVCKWEGCTYKKPFNRKADLSRHVESIHIAPRSYCCPVDGCSRLFNRKDRRDAHMLQCHLVSSIQKQAKV